MVHMNIDFILYCFVGGLVYMDTDAVGQFMISQPLVASTAAGAIFGNWALGLTVGMILQLPYLVEIPVGGTKVAMGNLGAYVAAGLAAQLAASDPNKLLLAFALFFGVLISRGAIPLQDGLRCVNLWIAHRADAAAENGSLAAITRYQYVGALLAFLFGVIVSGMLAMLGVVVWGLLAPLSSGLKFNGGLIEPLLLGAGAGAVLYLFLKRETVLHALIGAGIGVVYLVYNYL